MDRSLFLGITSGVLVFIVACSFILLKPPDFDAQLILQVDRGVPESELIPQIEKESFRMDLKAKKYLYTTIMDRKYWGNGDLADPVEHMSHVDNYESQTRIIKEYKNLRTKFVRGEITKEEFLYDLQFLDNQVFPFNIFDEEWIDWKLPQKYI